MVDLPFVMPSEDSAAVGIHIVIQGYVNGVLSNPATIPMAYPYFQPADATVITSPNPMQQANFGDRVALGDLNDDGDVDIVVGAWFEDSGGLNKSGRVYVFWGPDYSTPVALDPVDPKPWGELGIGLAIADMNGDGVDDLLAAEDSGDGTLAAFGYLHIYHGDSAFPDRPSLTIQSPGTGPVYSFWGRALTTGDFNGDTFEDIAVGVPKATVAGFENAGRVDVYWGPTYAARGEVLNPAPAADDDFGVHVASGDASGDGIDDLIECSCGDDVGGLVNIGSAHIFAGLGLPLFKTIPNPLPDGNLTCFGWALHAADLDGDGRVEVITSDQRSRAFIFWSGSYDTYQVIPKPPAVQQNPFGETAYGDSFATGDINSDGILDLLIGDPFEGELDCSITAGGTLFGCLGPSFSTFHRVTDLTPECSYEFAWSVVVHDPGDGTFLTVVAGSPTADNFGIFNTGQITVFELP